MVTPCTSNVSFSRSPVHPLIIMLISSIFRDKIVSVALRHLSIRIRWPNVHDMPCLGMWMHYENYYTYILAYFSSFGFVNTLQNFDMPFFIQMFCVFCFWKTTSDTKLTHSIVLYRYHNIWKPIIVCILLCWNGSNKKRKKHH